MMETNSEKLLPRKATNFAELIDNNLVYVDKTDLVADLAQLRGPFFLSRPRRFGKSVLLTTFKELFLHGKEKFRGLKLEEKKPWTDHTYKVLHFDFSRLTGQSPDLSFKVDHPPLTANELDLTFKENFFSLIENKFKATGLSWGNNPVWERNFEDALDACEDNSLVLLIDEYDTPLTHVLNKPDEYDKRRELFYYFYSTIKSCTIKFRFIFITGVTRITNIGTFSGPNNVRDISFYPDYGAITGFTQKELERNFRPYITNASKVLRKLYPDAGWNKKKVLDGLKQTYDGYSFDLLAEKKVYNPWSVINFFASPRINFFHYWLSSANSTLVNEFLERLLANPDDWFDVMDFLNNEPVHYSYDDLSPVISHLGQENFPLKAVLYQAGYLTIKGTKGKRLSIGIPNEEVKTAFVDVVLAKLTQKKKKSAEDLADEYLQSIRGAFATKDLPAMMKVMNDIINSFSYECFKQFDERMFAEVLKVLIFILTLFRFKCDCQIHTAKGRADLHIRGGKYHYIFEVKVVYDRNEADAAFEKGKVQFMDRKYANLIEPLIIVPGVMVIVNEPKKKELNENEKEEGSPSMLREIVRLEELSLTDEQMAALKGACLQEDHAQP